MKLSTPTLLLSTLLPLALSAPISLNPAFAARAQLSKLDKKQWFTYVLNCTTPALTAACSYVSCSSTGGLQAQFISNQCHNGCSCYQVDTCCGYKAEVEGVESEAAAVEATE
ncbi:hypothetical protein V8E51_004713 [Hyaloscypha variabilis]